MLLVEDGIVNGEVVTNKRSQTRALAVSRSVMRAWIALEPDVGVETALVAGMSSRSRTTARLADVSDQKRGLTGRPHLLR